MSTSIEVDCATCVVRDTDACDDCLVTYICDREPGDAVIITIEELLESKGKSFDPHVENMLPCLLKKASDTNTFISDQG